MHIVQLMSYNLYKKDNTMVKLEQAKIIATNMSEHRFNPEVTTSMKFDTNFLFGAAGDIIELDAWVPDNAIEQIDTLNADPSKILRSRVNDDYNGPKAGYEYNVIPESWNIPEHTESLGSLIYYKGDFLAPKGNK